MKAVALALVFPSLLVLAGIALAQPDPQPPQAPDNAPGIGPGRGPAMDPGMGPRRGGGMRPGRGPEGGPDLVDPAEMPRGGMGPAMGGMEGPDAEPVKERAAYLGAVVDPASPALRHQLGIPRGMGLVVDWVDPEGPAKAAGLRQHDVLLKLEDQHLVNPAQLAVLVRSHDPGESVNFTVKRQGKDQTIAVKLVEKEMPLLEHVTATGPQSPEMREFIERMRKQMLDRLRQGEPGRLLPGGRGPQRPDGAGAGPEGDGGRGEGRPLRSLTAASVSFSDGEHSISLQTTDGSRHLTIKDKEGSTVFDGPIDTEEQRQAIPAEFRKKLELMRVFRNRWEGAEPGASKPRSDPTTRPVQPGPAPAI